MIHKVYTFRMYLNKILEILINEIMGCSRFVCNHFLSLWDKAYQELGNDLKYQYMLYQTSCPENEFVWLKK